MKPKMTRRGLFALMTAVVTGQKANPAPYMQPPKLPNYVQDYVAYLKLTVEKTTGQPSVGCPVHL